MLPNIEYDETYSPAARIKTVRLLIAMALAHGWPVEHFDIPCAYLNGKCSRLVVVKVPPYWEKFTGQKFKKDICILMKSLYGNPEAGNRWNHVANDYLLSIGNKRCHCELCLYVKFEKLTPASIIALFVDDFFATGASNATRIELFRLLEKRFNCKNLGVISYALGIGFDWDDQGCFMSQQLYIQKILKRFNMESCHPSPIPFDSGFKATKSQCPQLMRKKKR